MGPNAKLAIAAGVASAYLIGIVVAIVAILGSGLEGAEQEVFAGIVDRRLGALLMVGFAACVFAFLMLRAAHEFLVLVPARTAEECGAMLEQPATRLSEQGSGELRRLIACVNRLADARQSREADVEARVRAANAVAEAERNRFAVLMAELAQGVIVVNLDGRILLYNRRARSLLAASGGHAMASLGLGRSIYGVFDRHLIAYALEGLAAESGSHRHFIAVSESGRLLRVLAAAVPHGTGEPATPAAAAGGAQLSGYLLMIDDMTETFESESVRDQLLQELTESSRGPVANLRAAAETLHDYPDMGPEERQRFLAVARDEAALLGGRIEAAAQSYAAVLKARWPLEDMLGAGLLAAARQRIADRCPLRVGLEEVDADVWVKVDGFSLLLAMTYFAARLHDEYEIRDLALRLTRDGGMAHVDLIWSGASMSTETVMHWELDPMHVAGESSPLTVRDVVERCGGEVWFQRERAVHRSFFRFLLPVATGRREAPAAALPDSRPEFYDFDLFRVEEHDGALDDRPLTQLAYTVFDTETTGLKPSEGDEIIQIGAVRVVNRRLLLQESFEQLIDPQRSLPAKSVQIHGITAEMLAGQPTIGRVLPIFRAYVGDTVLVAHNAAFDMRFLEIKEATTGVRFDRPVLDTFLLSAVIFPNQESHRLEAIADRLGVSVLGRHTAVGDAIVTAEVFLKMLPLLAEMGIRSLREAREASEKTYHARISY